MNGESRSVLGQFGDGLRRFREFHSVSDNVGHPLGVLEDISIASCAVFAN